MGGIQSFKHVKGVFMDRIKDFLEQKYVFLILLFALVVVIIYQIPDIIMLFFISFVIASALNPGVDWLSKKMPRGMAVLTVYLIAFLLLVLFLVPVIDIAIKQIISLIKDIPGYANNLYIMLSHFTAVHHLSYRLPNISQILSSSSSYGKEFIAGSISATMGLAGGLVILFTTAMIILYMLLDKNYLTKTYLKFFPINTRSRAEEISASISGKVGGFVLGQVISLVAVAVLITIGYTIIGLHYSILLGLITGVLDIIPIVGPFIAVSLALIIAIAQKPILAVWVLIIFCIVQWATNVFIRPLVFSKFLDLHPLVIIFSLLVAGTKLGLVGVIISPAIAATICVLIDELYIKRINTEK